MYREVCLMLSLSVPVLLVITIIASVLSSLSKAFYTKKVSASSADIDIFNIVLNLTCAAVVVIQMGGLGSFSVYSVVLGLVFGALCVFQIVTNMQALGIGPFSYTTVLISLSAIIPTLCGPFFGETIDTFQYIGIVLMIACILMSNDKAKNGEEKKASVRWLVLCLISVIFNGSVGVFQKIHQASSHKDEIPAFLVSAFLFAAAYSAVSLVVGRRKAEVRAEQKFKLRSWHIAIPLVNGLSLGTCHVVNLFLSGVVPAATFFPIVNLIPFALSTIAAMILFKERLSVKRWIGVGIGVISTLFVTGVVSAWFGF